MACEPFLKAGTKARIVNALIWFFIFASWISTMNSFGNVLHKDHQVFQQGSKSVTETVQVYWQRYTAFGNEYNFNDVLMIDIDADGEPTPYGPFRSVNSCVGAGRGWVAMNVFAFLAIIPLLLMNTGRLSGIGFPKVNSAAESMLYEFYLSIAVMLLLFLAVAIWGWGCLATFSEIAGSDITGVGFGYTVACLIFMMITTFVFHMMRHDPTIQVGIGLGIIGDRSQPLNQTDEYDASADVEHAFTYETTEPENTTQG